MRKSENNSKKKTKSTNNNQDISTEKKTRQEKAGKLSDGLRKTARSFGADVTQSLAAGSGRSRFKSKESEYNRNINRRQIQETTDEEVILNDGKLTTDEWSADEGRLRAGTNNHPRDRVESEGREIMLVVEELMEQTAILKNRLIGMLEFFQSTVSAYLAEIQEAQCPCISSTQLGSKTRSYGQCSNLLSQSSKQPKLSVIEDSHAGQSKQPPKTDNCRETEYPQSKLAQNDSRTRSGREPIKISRNVDKSTKRNEILTMKGRSSEMPADNEAIPEDYHVKKYPMIQSPRETKPKELFEPFSPRESRDILTSKPRHYDPSSRFGVDTSEVPLEPTSRSSTPNESVETKESTSKSSSSDEIDPEDGQFGNSLEPTTRTKNDSVPNTTQIQLGTTVDSSCRPEKSRNRSSSTVSSNSMFYTENDSCRALCDGIRKRSAAKGETRSLPGSMCSIQESKGTPKKRATGGSSSHQEAASGNNVKKSSAMSPHTSHESKRSASTTIQESVKATCSRCAMKRSRCRTQNCVQRIDKRARPATDSREEQAGKRSPTADSLRSKRLASSGASLRSSHKEKSGTTDSTPFQGTDSQIDMSEECDDDQQPASEIPRCSRSSQNSSSKNFPKVASRSGAGSINSSQKKVRIGECTLSKSNTRSRSGSNSLATTLPQSDDLANRVFQVQEEIEELREQMSTFQDQIHPSKINHKNRPFPGSFSAQLLDKAEEIKSLLNSLKSDCYQRIYTSYSDLPHAGKQTVTQKCEKKIERIHPEFTRTVQQVQNIKGDRNRTGKTQYANISEEMETKVRTKYKDQEASENIMLTKNVHATERLEDINSQERHRQTKTQTERTVKMAGKDIYEKRKVDENDQRRKDERVINTKKKVIRKEAVDGEEPKKRIVTNIQIRRVIDNKTGKITETMTQFDDESDEDETPPGTVTASRSHAGESRAIEPEHSSESNSVFIEKQYLDHTGRGDIESKAINQRSKRSGCRQRGPNEPASVLNRNQIRKQSNEPPARKHRKTCIQAKSPDTRSNLVDLSEHYIYETPAACSESRHSAGTEIKSICSKIMYVAKNSEIPGVRYIGCEESDMSKYSNRRSRVTEDNRLVFEETIPAKQSIRIGTGSKPKQVEIKADSSLQRKEGQPRISDAENIAAGGTAEPNVPCQEPSTTPRPSRGWKFFKKDSSNVRDDNRTKGGSVLISQPDYMNSPRNSQEPVQSSRARSSDRGQPATAGSSDRGHSSSRGTGSTLVQPIRPEAVGSIADVIKELSGNRSREDFFVSILPERIETKTFRVNVIDKATGNLLGYFFVNEEKFLKARDEGVFDNYLSLFVLNSLTSYGDFVKMKNNINRATLQQRKCTPNNNSKEK